jgi:hypothetical protein
MVQHPPHQVVDVLFESRRVEESVGAAPLAAERFARFPQESGAHERNRARALCRGRGALVAAGRGDVRGQRVRGVVAYSLASSKGRRSGFLLEDLDAAAKWLLRRELVSGDQDMVEALDD